MSSNPENIGKLPEIEALSSEQVLKRMSDVFPTAPLAENWKTIWEGGETPEENAKRQRDLRYLLVEYETNLGSTRLNLKNAADANLFKAQMESMTEARQDLLGVVLEGMGKQRSTANAFIELPDSNKKSIGEEIEELEDSVFALAPEKGEKNPLYVFRGGRAFPSFPRLKEAEDRLTWILQNGMKRDAQGKPDEGTSKRVMQLEQGLTLIRNMNPIGEAIYKKEHDGSPNILSTPLKLAGVGIAGLMAVLSLIPVITKIVKGEELTASDWPAAAWPALFAYLGGFFPKGGKQLEQVVKVGVNVQGNKYFRNTVAKMGVDAAIPAVQELHDLLEEPDNRKLLRDALKIRKPSEEFLKEFTGKTEAKDSALLELLTRKEIANEDRQIFLATLYDLNVRDQNALDAVLAALKNPEMMKTT